MDVHELKFHELPIPLDRDRFVRELLRDLVAALARSQGEDVAADFVSDIGERTGHQFNVYYKAALKSSQLTREQIAAALVDLKARIEGDFYVIEISEDKIVLGNRACPFGRKVLDRPALCMMTSSVFGAIASENTGYAKVDVQRAIARHDAECRVVVYLKPSPAANEAQGREYTRTIAERLTSKR